MPIDGAYIFPGAFSYINPLSPLEQAAGLTSASIIGYAYAPGYLRRYGATGDGVTDDSAAWTAAHSTGHNVIGTPGDTYLVTPATNSTVGVLVDMTGCTIKLKASTAGFTLTLGANYQNVRGGIWDGNKANQSGSTPDYTRANILISADYCTVTDTTHQNCYGIGIKGAGCNYATIRFNKISGTSNHGMFIDCNASDCLGNVIAYNEVQMAANTAVGIYLHGNQNTTPLQRLWNVSNNTVIGASSATTVNDVGIVTRGVDGVLSNNSVKYFDLAISADSNVRTTITGNRVETPNGPTAYCLELNGNNNVVCGNYLKGGNYGIVNSNSGLSNQLDFVTITGNQIDNPATGGIYFNPSNGGTHAYYLNVSGNTITFDTVGGSVKAIFLQTLCKYGLISGNQIVGPGSGATGARAIQVTDAGSSFCISGNKFSGWFRTFSVFSSGAVTFNNIAFVNNDCTQDMTSSAFFVITEGSAVLGANVQQFGNQEAASTGLNTRAVVTAGTATFTIDNSVTTGAATATFTATNKPGSNSSPTKWLPIIADGTTYYVPLWT